jgi:hypothetical protein
MKAGRTRTRYAQTFDLLIDFHPFAFGGSKWVLITRYVAFSGHVIMALHLVKKARL